MVRLSIAFVIAIGLLSSCSDRSLPNEYRLRTADRGKAWLHDPDDFVVLNYVTAVGHNGQMIFTETRNLRDKPPYGYEDCRYHVTDSKTRKTVDLALNDGPRVNAAKEQIRVSRIFMGTRSCLANNGD